MERTILIRTVARQPKKTERCLKKISEMADRVKCFFFGTGYGKGHDGLDKYYFLSKMMREKEKMGEEGTYSVLIDVETGGNLSIAFIDNSKIEEKKEENNRFENMEEYPVDMFLNEKDI